MPTISNENGRSRAEKEKYPNGKLHITSSAKVTGDGTYLLDGRQTVHYPNGKTQYEATYQNGKKSGAEKYWSQSGGLLWQWDRRNDGTNVWTQFWPNGKKKSESFWNESRCFGKATLWNVQGKVISEQSFLNGNFSSSLPWVVRKNLQVGDHMYTDRNYQFTSIPKNFIGQEWIQASNDSTDSDADPLATFTVRVESDVYVAHCDDAKLPAWLADWKKTDEKIQREGKTLVSFSIFQKRFQTTDLIQLGWNGQVGGADQYIVIAKPVILIPLAENFIQELKAVIK
ncbi:MAG: hypothetical protein ABIR24_14295 [Verrucomicrobiota bacterium]